MKKRILPVVISVFLTLTAIPSKAPAAASFSDVPSHHWAAGTINSMVDQKILSGYADGTFQPERRVTRAEFAVMLVKATGINTPGVDKPTFADVPAGNWSLPFVEAARGYFFPGEIPGQTGFRPENPALRQEAVAALARAKGLGDEADLEALQNAFKDYENIGPEYRIPIASAVKNKFVAGYSDGNFKPGDPLTRAEAAALIYKAFLFSEFLQNWINNGTIKPFTETKKDYMGLTVSLSSQFGEIAVNHSPVKVNYFARDLQLAGETEPVLLVFGRIDPFKYFTFSDADYRTKPAAVKEFAGSVALKAAEEFPERKIIVMVGYTNLIYYNPMLVYGSKYVFYSPAEDGWRVNRLYAGAVAHGKQITDSWSEMV